MTLDTTAQIFSGINGIRLESGGITPSLTFGGSTVGVTYGTRSGGYTIVDDRLIFNLNLPLTSKGSSVGDVEILTNLPSELNAAEASACSMQITNILSGRGERFLSAALVAGTTNIRLHRMGIGDAIVRLTDADFNNNTVVQLSGSWRIA